MRIIGFDSKFYARKHGSINTAIVDKDRLRLDEVENLNETDQIVSYKPENHRFRLDCLRPETWDH